MRNIVLNSGVRGVVFLVATATLFLLVGCGPQLQHQVGVSRVLKTVPEQQRIELDGTPGASFADDFLKVSVYERDGNLGLQLQNVAGRSIALLQEQITFLDQAGGRHDFVTAGSMRAPVVAVPKGGSAKDLFPLQRLSAKQAGSSTVSVLLPVMVEGIYHEYHLSVKVHSTAR